MPQLAVALLSAASVTGPGTGVDLAAGVGGTQCRSLTMHVTAADPGAVVALEGSLDNANWFGLTSRTGPGFAARDGVVVQYVRGNVTKLPAGTVSALVGFVSG